MYVYTHFSYYCMNGRKIEEYDNNAQEFNYSHSPWILQQIKHSYSNYKRTQILVGFQKYPYLITSISIIFIHSRPVQI